MLVLNKTRIQISRCLSIAHLCYTTLPLLLCNHSYTVANLFSAFWVSLPTRCHTLCRCIRGTFHSMHICPYLRPACFEWWTQSANDSEVVKHHAPCDFGSKFLIDHSCGYASHQGRALFKVDFPGLGNLCYIYHPKPCVATYSWNRSIFYANDWNL